MPKQQSEAIIGEVPDHQGVTKILRDEEAVAERSARGRCPQTRWTVFRKETNVREDQRDRNRGDKVKEQQGFETEIDHQRKKDGIGKSAKITWAMPHDQRLSPQVQFGDLSN